MKLCTPTENIYLKKGFQFPFRFFKYNTRGTTLENSELPFYETPCFRPESQDCQPKQIPEFSRLFFSVCQAFTMKFGGGFYSVVFFTAIKTVSGELPRNRNSHIIMLRSLTFYYENFPSLKKHRCDLKRRPLFKNWFYNVISFSTIKLCTYLVRTTKKCFNVGKFHRS